MNSPHFINIVVLVYRPDGQPLSKKALKKMEKEKEKEKKKAEREAKQVGNNF